MPLPSGFKVNGAGVKSENRLALTPREKKAISLLDKLPVNELLTSMELSVRLGANMTNIGHRPGMKDHRERVDNKLFWGSRKSIALLRKKLAEPEDSSDHN